MKRNLMLILSIVCFTAVFIGTAIAVDDYIGVTGPLSLSGARPRSDSDITKH